MSRKRTPESSLQAELRFHMQKLVEQYVASGMSPGEAERQARLEFGGIEQIKEECRDVRGRWLADLAQDVGYALRSMRRGPAFPAVAVLTLALGIGATTAIFSLINAVMLLALPVPHPERLVQITRMTPNGRPGVVSYKLFEYFRNNLKSIAAASAFMSSGPTIVMDGQEDVVSAELASGSYYAVLGVEPAAGRLLEPGDDFISPAYPAAVISDRYWQRRFGRDPAAIGKTFSLRNNVFTIVGVTPPQYQGAITGRDPDITLPLSMMLTAEARGEFTNNFLNLIARLRPGATVEQTNAEVQVLWQSSIQEQAAQAKEKDRPGILRQHAAAFPSPSGVNPLQYNYSEPLLVLMGIVSLVLLLACANLSGLLLARAASRQREISIRLAIGAGRGRLIRQFLSESLVLATLGGGAGLLVAYWFSGVLVAMLANGAPIALSVAPDGRVLAFTGAVSLAACVFSGLAPGVHAVRCNLNPALKEARSGGHGRLGQSLVIAQLSISMVLIVSATLFIETLVKLYRLDRGLRTEGVLTFSVRTSQRYPADRSLAVQTALLDRLSALPGVTSASASQVVPIGGGLWTRRVQVEGYAFRPDESEDVGFNVIGPKYFATVGTPLLLGREFGVQDGDAARKVAIVNESFARYFFGSQSPLGRQVTSVGVTYQIVGLVKDAMYQNLKAGLLKTMYIPWMQRAGEQPGSYTYLARVAGGDPMRLAPALERMVRETDPGLRLRAPRSYDEIVDQSIVTERIMATLGGFFGVLALIVACLGMFGLMAFQVSRRIHELGIRMALGAHRSDILVLVLRDVALMLAAGSVMGGAAALALSGLAGKMLFGVTPTEPGVFALSAMVLAASALAAAWLPARRASRVAPMAALRHE